MVAGSDNKFPKLILEEVLDDGSATTTPAADHRALFLGEDGTLRLKDSSAGVSDVGGGGADDPVAEIFGAPDTAFEFDTSSLAGLTVIGGAATEDADTTVPGWLFYKATDAGTAWHGRYLASPTAPFTAITKINVNHIADFNAGGLIVGVANPNTGAYVANEVVHSTDRRILAGRFTNRTTFDTILATSISALPPDEMFLGIVVNSTTSVDYYWSMKGRVWRRYLAASNPTMTIASVGVAMVSQNAGGAAVAFDFLRIWNSAKTFPGV